MEPHWQWQWLRFDALGRLDLHDLLKLRVDVFVVEQRCAYPEIDGLDLDALHLLCRNDKELAGYLRLLPPGTKRAEASLGRVVTAAHARGQGVGRGLVERGIKKCRSLYPTTSIRISAQAHLSKFYAGFGFEAVSGIYDEDGIPHLDMLLAKR